MQTLNLCFIVCFGYLSVTSILTSENWKYMDNYFWLAKKNCEFFPPFMAVLIPVVTRKKQHFNCGQCSDNLEAECAGLWFCLDLPVLPLEQHSGSQGKDERANKNRKISQTLSLKDCMFYFRSIKADSISIKPFKCVILHPLHSET